MRKAFIILLVLGLAVCAFAFNVNDNPIGGSYPYQMRRSVKGTPVSFVLSTIGDSATIHTALDTTSGAWTFVWTAPFRCRVDSFKLVNGKALLAADTASTRYWIISGISNNSATNADTVFRDSTMRWPLTSNAITSYNVWTSAGGPDSASCYLDKGKTLRFSLSQYGGAGTAMKWFGEFFVVPADKE